MVDILKADYRSLEQASKTLIDGKVIAFPTETVYGIGVHFGNDAAVEKMRQIKGRDGDKPFQVLIPNIQYAYRYAMWDDPRVEALMNKFWPGAMTLILPGYNGGTVGLRVPKCKWLQVLMFDLGSAIVATSANISGAEPAVTATDIDDELGIDLGLVIDGGEAEIGHGSTVVRIDENGDLDVLRHGAITEKELKDVYYN